MEGDQPQGRDTRQEFDPSSPYQVLRTARGEARDAERRAMQGDSDAPPANWGAVAGAAIDLISDHSKDLEAAAWLIEALVRTDGVLGLGAGAAVFAGLVRNFWGALYPGADEDDPDDDPAEACMRPLSGLASGTRATLPQPLRLVPLFYRADGSQATLSDYDAASSLEGLDETAKEQRIAEGAATLAMLEEEARRDPQALARLARDAEAALEAWDDLDRALSENAGRAKPNLGGVRDVAARIAGFARRLAPAEDAADAGAAASDSDMTAASAASGAPAQGGAVPMAQAGGGAPGPIASREDALKRLDEVAKWFRRTEPHSPLAYTLDEAVRRGRMTLPELLAEIVPDYATRSTILTSLGIKPPSEYEESSGYDQGSE